jgi:hypothetical protein
VSEPTTDAPDDETDAAGQDDETSGVPNPETGVGIGAGEASTFEPEEDEPT